jgi:hypothetical protein
MAFDISNPLSGLAWDMATRAIKAGEKAKSQYDYERSLINKRLTPYGGDIDLYQNEWDRAYGPSSNAGQAQAESWRNYWTGLPELMTAAAKEGTASASAGASSYKPIQAPEFSMEDIYGMLGITGPTTARTGSSADALEGMSRSRFQPRTRNVRPIRPQQGR